MLLVLGTTACGKKKDDKKSKKLSNKSPEDVIEAYINAFTAGDASTGFRCTIPEESMETYFEKAGIKMDPEDMMSGYTEIAQKLIEGLKDEDYELEVEYDVKACETIDELDELKSEAKEALGVKSLEAFQNDKNIAKSFKQYYAIDVEDIDDVAFAKVKIKYTLGGKKISSETKLFYLFKYDGGWYMMNEPDMTYNDIVEKVQDDSAMKKDLKSVIKEYSSEIDDFNKEITKSDKDSSSKNSKKYDDDDDDDDDDDWDDSSRYDDDDDDWDDDDDDWDDSSRYDDDDDDWYDDDDDSRYDDDDDDWDDDDDDDRYDDDYDFDYDW